MSSRWCLVFKKAFDLYFSRDSHSHLPAGAYFLKPMEEKVFGLLP